jgi:hypothetical protein
MIRINVADIIIDILSNKLCEPNGLVSFYSSDKRAPDLKVFTESLPLLAKPTNVALSSLKINWSHNTSIDSAYLYNEEVDKVFLTLSVDKSYYSAFITYLESFCNEEYAVTGPLGELLFRNKIIYNQGIVIHSAAIEWNSKGVIFAAPAGTGKSTQAELWVKYMGAKVLNGDRPALRIINGQPYVYGTPWSGSSPDYVNAKAPLSAIVLLQQAPRNSILKLQPREAITYLMPRCFLPYHDSSLMDIAIDNLESIISSVPIFLLKCRPDKEAVELVYECLK